MIVCQVTVHLPQVVGIDPYFHVKSVACQKNRPEIAADWLMALYLRTVAGFRCRELSGKCAW